MKLICLLLLGMVALSSCSFPFSVCPNSPSHFSVSNVDIAPNPPVKGQLVSVAITGNIDEQVTSGKVAINVKFVGIPIFSQSNNWGDGTSLPAGPGVITYKYSITIPSIAPPGSYEIDVSFTDQNNSPVACVFVTLAL